MLVRCTAQRSISSAVQNFTRGMRNLVCSYKHDSQVEMERLGSQQANVRIVAATQALIELALTAPAQFKLFHWQTRSYARHKSLDAIQDKLQEKFDQLLETLSGKFDVRLQAPQTFRVAVNNLPVAVADNVEVNTISDYADNVIATLNGMERTLNIAPEQLADLVNIRDEIVGEINRFKYLLGFH